MSESVQASDIPANDDAERLEKVLQRRRDELGIKPEDLAPPASELPPVLTPEQEALRERRWQAQQAAERERKCSDAVAALVEKAGRRYASCSLASFRVNHPRQQAVVNAVREYLADLPARFEAREGVVFYGPVGTGKDHLAFAVAMEALGAGRSVGWVNGQDWFGDLRDAMDDNKISERQAIGRLSYPSLLVISDPLPPVGDLGQHMATMLYRLVGDRYDDGKPTIITVNVADDDEAHRRMGVPTWDRICDGAWKLRCAWPSYRKPAREVK